MLLTEVQLKSISHLGEELVKVNQFQLLYLFSLKPEIEGMTIFDDNYLYSAYAVIFKTVAISKIIFQVFIATVPKHIVNELKKILKAFFGIILPLR